MRFVPHPSSRTLTSLSIFLIILSAIVPKLIGCIALSLATTALSEQVYATYSATLNDANQSRLHALLQDGVGLCGSDSTIVGYLNTSNNDLVVMVSSDDTTQTIEQWEQTTCGKAIVAWLTPLELVSPVTDESFNQECVVDGTATCGTTAASVCPCVASQTEMLLFPLSKQVQLGSLVFPTTGACADHANIVDPLNTIEGIMLIVHSAGAGQTLWEFENTTECGKALIALNPQRKTDMAVVQPIIDECFGHGDHGHCSTATTSLCQCSASEDVIFNIATDQVAAFTALRAEGGVCVASPPSRTTIFATVNITTGLQLYVRTRPGATKYDFDRSACGTQIGLIKDIVVKTGTDATEIVNTCWEHGDHAHCGSSLCPCPVPASLAVTPIQFTLNMTHTSTEGALLFNNFFIPAVRAHADCKFTRYLATYADSKGFSLRVYFDQLKSTCTLAILEEINLSAFRTYWDDAVARYNEEDDHDDDDHDHDDDSDHSGHNHFQLTAVAQHAKAGEPEVAGILSIKVATSMDLSVEDCWNPQTNGLFCVGQSSKCTQIICPVGALCSSPSDCGTGLCVEGEHDDDDDHSGHNHNVVRVDATNGIVIEPFVLAQFSALADDHDHEHTFVCGVDTRNSAYQASFALIAMIVLFVAIF